MNRINRPAITLVEILIVISIIGILVSLMLPAIEMSREAGRRTQCENNLHQITLAIMQHETAQLHYPTGGWGWAWVGDPDRGFGRQQPGGWIYNILPYLDYSDIHELGKHSDRASKRRAAVQLQMAVIPVFTCPSRRLAKAYPCQHSESIHNSDPVKDAAKTDYAANGGDFPWEADAGPESYEQGDSNYKWNFPANDPKLLSGICYLRSEVQHQDIIDGLSKTYLVGEKFHSPGEYKTGNHPGDDMSMYQGDDPDITRWGRVNVALDNPELDFEDRTCGPLQDKEKPIREYRFGSAHPGGFHMAFCDGSVRRISYDIDLQIHEWLANRKDGHAVSVPE